MPNLIRRGRPRTNRSRGQSFAEFALVAPILLLLFAAAADLGRLFYGYVAIENAAKEGAFFGSTKPICDDNSAASCVNPNNVFWRVRNELSGIRNPDGPDAGTQPDELTPTVQCLDQTTGAAHATLSDCVEGDTYRVGLSYQFRLLTPILGQLFGNGLTLNTTATSTVVNEAIDFSPGVTIQKLVEAASADNGAAVIANCLEPLDQPSPGFYRSPCRNTNNNNNPLHLEYDTGDAITYEVTVTNTGFGTLTGVTMVDSLGWPGSCAARPTTLNEDQSYTCTYTRTAPAVPGAGIQMDYINTLTVDANQINAAQDGVTVKVKKPPARLNVTVWLSPFKLGGDGDGVPGFGTLDTLAIGTNSNATITETVWYKVVLQNTGGQTATGLTLTDTNGPLTPSADCPAVPTSLAAGATYTCLYARLFPAPETRTNTLTAQSPDAVPTTNSDTATVTATACVGPAMVVPNLVRVPQLDKAAAVAAWTAAGFTSTLTTWNGQNNATVDAQSLQAYSCRPANVAMTVFRDPTP